MPARRGYFGLTGVFKRFRGNRSDGRLQVVHHPRAQSLAERLFASAEQERSSALGTTPPFSLGTTLPLIAEAP